MCKPAIIRYNNSREFSKEKMGKCSMKKKGVGKNVGVGKKVQKRGRSAPLKGREQSYKWKS